MDTLEKDKIIERLLKVKALVENGADGEREAAERLLTSLMRQYNITIEDLESDVVSYHLTYIGEERYDWMLFRQITLKLFENSDRVKIVDIRKAPKSHKKTWAEAGFGPKNSNIGLYCTKAEFAEVMCLFELYQKDMHQQEDVFFYAYLSKNDLLLKPKKNNEELTEEEINQYRKAMIMADGIDKKIIYKEIKQNHED